MKTFIIGSRDDAAGFALAGVVPITPADLDAIDAEAVLIFSPDAARRESDRLAVWSRTGTGPPFIVLRES